MRGSLEKTGDGQSQAPRGLREGKQQGREDRAEAPDGRQIEEKGLHRRRRVEPGDGPDEDEDVHREQQADARPRQANGEALESLRPLRGPDGRPQAEEQVNLGEYRETDDDEPEGAEGQ